jgi:hypothetical protein
VFLSGLFVSFESGAKFAMFQSQKYHLENPYWKTFDPYVVPLLDKKMDLRRHEELDTSKDVEVPV